MAFPSIDIDSRRLVHPKALLRAESRRRKRGEARITAHKRRCLSQREMMSCFSFRYQAEPDIENLLAGFLGR
jgi:hypothetical protein